MTLCSPPVWLPSVTVQLYYSMIDYIPMLCLLFPGLIHSPRVSFYLHSVSHKQTNKITISMDLVSTLGMKGGLNIWT